MVRTSPERTFFHKDDVQEIMINILFIYARQNPRMCYRQVYSKIALLIIYIRIAFIFLSRKSWINSKNIVIFNWSSLSMHVHVCKMFYCNRFSKRHIVLPAGYAWNISFYFERYTWRLPKLWRNERISFCNEVSMLFFCASITNDL